jgi:hypothetical protein
MCGRVSFLFDLDMKYISRSLETKNEKKKPRNKQRNKALLFLWEVKMLDQAKQVAILLLASVGHMLGLHFDPEDRGDMFL